MNLFGSFSKPHPFIFNLSSVLLPGVVTFLIIGLLAPFDFQQMDLINRLWFGALLGVIASASVFLVVTILKRLYTSYDDQWTMGKEMLLVLSVVVTIAFFVFLFFQLADLTEVKSFQLFKLVFLKTVMISILPVIILVLYEQYNHQKKQYKQATEMNDALGKADVTKNEDLIQLLGENGKMELQLTPKELIFLKSDGNYVEVFYGKEQPQKKLVRNRLKALSDALPESFFHCHKSYVVNKLSIVSVEGNARNFELKLRGVSDSIPVSRSKSAELSQFLKG